MTVSQVAKLLQLSEKTVYRLAQRGELPGFKVGGQWRFNQAVLESWMAERSHTGTRRRKHR